MSADFRFRPEQIVGPWQLEAPLGRGGFSEVWRAQHTVSKTTVALKIVVHPEHAAALRAEAQTLSVVRGDGIVQTIASDLESEPPWIALRLCRGGDLRQRLASVKGRLLPSAALQVFERILAILARVHREGIVHGDLKPENVLSDQGQLRLADFGLSRRICQTTATLSVSLSRADARLAGTLDYMAPEQREGARPTPRSDLYAAGVILHELLFGERPQGVSAPASTRDPRLPSYVDRVFERMLALDPKTRFESGSDALRFLRGAHWAECAALKKGLRGLRDRRELVRAWPLVWGVMGVAVVFVVAGEDTGYWHVDAEQRQRAVAGAFVGVLLPLLGVLPALARENRAILVEIARAEEQLKTLLAWRVEAAEVELPAEAAARRIRHAAGPTGLARWLKGFVIRCRRLKGRLRRRLV